MWAHAPWVRLGRPVRGSPPGVRSPPCAGAHAPCMWGTLWMLSPVPAQQLHRRQRQELLEVVRRRELSEQRHGLAEAAAVVGLGADLAAHALHLLGDEPVEQRRRRLLSVRERDPVMHPLPHLRAADLRGRSILHEIVEWHGALAAQPRFDVLDADADIEAQARLGPRALVHLEQVLLADLHVLAQAMELVRPRHQPIEDFLRDGHEIGMRHPGAVVAVGGLALLVGAHALERLGIRLRVAPVRDLRGHAAHRKGAAAMARPDEQQRVRAQERLAHHDLRAVGEHVGRVRAQLLDERKHVVPAPAVEPHDVLAQLVQDFVHLERGGQRLDEHGGLDRARRQSQALLRIEEHAVPEPRLLMALELRQIEVGPRPALELLARVVEEVQPEIKQAAGDRRAVDGESRLGQMPAARAHDQHGGIGSEHVALAGRRVREVERPVPAVEQVDLALEIVGPRGRVRVLEVRHEHLRARIERVDDHLAVDGSRDLHPAVLEVGRDGAHAPARAADVGGLAQEVRQLAGVVARLAERSRIEELRAARLEAAVQGGEEVERLRGENFLVPGSERVVDGHARRQTGCCWAITDCGGRHKLHLFPFRQQSGHYARRPPPRQASTELQQLHCAGKDGAGATASGGAGSPRMRPSWRLTKSIPTNVTSANPSMNHAGPVGEPVASTRMVDMTGAVPLNSEKARLNETATPLKRMRVGNRSATMPAIGPLQNEAASPAATNSGMSATLCSAAALKKGMQKTPSRSAPVARMKRRGMRSLNHAVTSMPHERTSNAMFCASIASSEVYPIVRGRYAGIAKSSPLNPAVATIAEMAKSVAAGAVRISSTKGLFAEAWRSFLNSAVSVSERRSQKLTSPRTPPNRKPIRQPQSATSAGVRSLLTAKPRPAASATPVLTQKKMKPDEKPARRGALSTTYVIAPGSSPPSENPCRSRSSTRHTVAPMPQRA